MKQISSFTSWSVITALIFAAASATQAADLRALVIGNAKYEGELALRNPGNDADDIAGALTGLGFSVTLSKDLDRTKMEDALLAFRRTLHEGDVAMFYYSGHGVEVNGANYLVPVGARIREAFEVKREAVDVGQVLDAMKDSGAKLNVLVLDCCRDNPLKRGWATRSIGGAARGLAAQNAPEGTLIAYSTAPGFTAADGEGRNSPYTSSLLQAMRTRNGTGLELKQLFFMASREVKKTTGQVPWLSLEASLEDFYLSGSAGSTPVGSSPPSPPVKPVPAPVGATTSPPTPQPVSFTLDSIFDGTSYDGFNSYSKKIVMRKAQEKLKNAGLYESSIDGVPGKGSCGAIQRWQTEHGLSPTGALDKTTLASMELTGIQEQEAPAPPPPAPRKQVENVQQSLSPGYGPAPGKPGFVNSPNGLIDCRGAASGTKMRDPYTGGIFFVP